MNSQPIYSFSKLIRLTLASYLILAGLLTIAYFMLELRHWMCVLRTYTPTLVSLLQAADPYCGEGRIFIPDTPLLTLAFWSTIFALPLALSGAIAIVISWFRKDDRLLLFLSLPLASIAITATLWMVFGSV